MSDRSTGPPIRVLVVDDSAFMRTALKRMIESDPSLQVVGAAQNGLDAIEMAAALDPDVLTMDVEMPRLDGLGALRRVMRENPKPVIMISSLTKEGAEAAVEALECGAFDCIPKQLSYASLDILEIRDELVAKIKAAAESPHVASFKASAKPEPPPSAAILRHAPANFCPLLIAIGASTGGPKALQEMLPRLPADLPVGILIVQHMPPGFTAPFARRLQSLSSIRITEAENEQEIRAGHILLAPATWHMTVYRRTHSQFAVRLSKSPENTLHRPSVDVMMLSAADACGAQTMAVILTGMGSDGAQGMKSIAEKGGYTVGQDEASCAVYGMPRSCAEMGALKRVLPLDQIPDEIVAATFHLVPR
jgi:two-component system, chemotaxis family, protein-glutamate methylesterase/glutaminase